MHKSNKKKTLKRVGLSKRSDFLNVGTPWTGHGWLLASRWRVRLVNHERLWRLEGSNVLPDRTNSVGIDGCCIYTIPVKNARYGSAG